MTARLSRAATGRPAHPVRSVHLGLGAFHRAHQATYAGPAGVAAFTGRRPDAAVPLTEQDGLYTLLVRGAEGDQATVVDSISAAHDGADLAALAGYLADPAVRTLTLTITEAGYHRDGAGDFADPADVAALRDGGAPRTAPGRLVHGLRARRRADAGPLAVVPCDNLADNGPTTQRVVLSLAAALEPGLADWIESSVGFVTTMVDRITPAATAADQAAAARLTGFADHAPVVTEPFTEWVLAEDFPPGTRPQWDRAGARFVPAVAPFETRKLWLLNGAHSLLAYAAPTRGHRTVDAAMSDPQCRAWLRQWWDEATEHLTLPRTEIAAYEQALTDRFSNPRIAHQLAQIAADGSQKLPVRVLPVLRAERSAGRLPGGAVRALPGWLAHLRAGADVRAPRAAELTAAAAGSLTDAAGRILDALDPELGGDDALRAAVAAEAKELTGLG